MFVFATLFSHLLNVTEYMPFERYSKQDHFTVTLHIIWQVNRKLSFHREQNFNVFCRDLVDIVNEHLMAVSWWRAPKEKWVLISLRLKNRTKKKNYKEIICLRPAGSQICCGFKEQDLITCVDESNSAFCYTSGQDGVTSPALLAVFCKKKLPQNPHNKSFIDLVFFCQDDWV